MAEKNVCGKKRAIEPMCYVPFCDIYTEQQMLGHRVGGPTPPEGTQIVRLLRWTLRKCLCLSVWQIQGAPGGAALLFLKTWPPRAAMGGSGCPSVPQQPDGPPRKKTSPSGSGGKRGTIAGPSLCCESIPYLSPSPRDLGLRASWDCPRDSGLHAGSSFCKAEHSWE